MPKKVPHGIGELIARTAVHFGLAGDRDTIFHRVLHGQHIALNQRLHAQRGMQRRALA